MISRGQMYRQLYYAGGEGIASLDAGAPSIKYTGDIKPEMASAPDPMAELYNMFLDLKQKGQIPKEMGFEQFKQLMEEQSSSQGGIMDMVPREQALLGGIKKAVKKVTGAVKDVVKSDLGKAALGAAAAYYAPALFGGTAGFGPGSTYRQFLGGLSPFAIPGAGPAYGGSAYGIGKCNKSRSR
jgi:hypothetical protein